MSGFDLSQNSTTVRSVFSGLQAISPALAAQLAAATMFRTRRKPRADWEQRRRFGDVPAYKGPRLDAPSLVHFARPNPVS